MKFLSDHFELGGKVGRVLFMRKYSSYIKDDMITSMADFPRTLVLSIDLLPVPTDEAVRDVQSQIMSIEAILPGGSRGRTPGTTLPPWSPMSWNSRGRRPRNFWTI